MARIVCQVLHCCERVTFLWSEGAAAFEPYHLEGAERAKLLDLAAQIHAQLAARDTAAAANLGQQLYRAVFRLDADDQAAAAVHGWLNLLAATNQIQKLEFLTDSPGLIPWNALSEDGSAQQFWGTRFSLGAGRRVNALRPNPHLPTLKPILAADVDLADHLSDTQRPALNAFRESGALLHSGPSLEDELKKRVPDILLLLARFDQGTLKLGSDALSVANLQAWMDDAREGNPDPIIILMGCGDPADNARWQTLLAQATAAFSGLIANESLLPGPEAFGVGHALCTQLIEGKESVGEILRALRQEQPAALAFSAFCPAQVRVTEEAATPDTEIEAAPLPRSPYRPFAAFDAADRALFFGREEDVIRGALIADQAGTKGILLHGSPAVGKTSYLQAGLLPYLEQESVGYRVLRDRSPVETPIAERDYPMLILRCTSDLAGQFADALTVFCAQPLTYTTPAGAQVTVDLPGLLYHTVTGKPRPTSTAIQASADAGAITTTPGESDAPKDDGMMSARELWIALRDNRDMLASVLDTLTRSLPFELVIAVDQGEELLTLVKTPQQQVRRRKALDMLMHLAESAARCKIVFTLRSQYLGQFLSLLPNDKAPAEWRSFHLRPLTESELVDTLLWPTNREEVPYSGEAPQQKYRFVFEEGSAQQIVADAVDAADAAGHGPLPIIQAAGALLYEKQVLGKRQEVVRVGDLKDSGGVKEALSKYFDHSVQQLPFSKQTQAALRTLIGKLYTSHADGTLSRDLVLASELKTYWRRGLDPVEAVVNRTADELGLFDIQQLFIGGESDVYVSLAQDSLTRLGRSIDSERDLQAYGRTKVIDTLWIMIPLAFLCATLSFCVTRNFFPGQAGSETKEGEDTDQKAAKKLEREARVLMAEKTRRPLYYGQIAQAEQALQAENALRARQILLGQPALRSYMDVDNFNLPDIRGFEWRYLWRNLNAERHVFAGQRGAVHAVAVSPDGKWAASAGPTTDSKNDGAIRIWDLATGNIVALMTGKSAPVNALAFAPDGKVLASAGADKIVRLWDVSNLKSEYAVITKEAKTLTGHTDAVLALAFGADAKALASAGADKSVIIWDASTGKEKHTLKEHTAAVNALVFVDAKTLASAGADGQLIWWDAEPGQKRQTVKTDYQSITALAISYDGKALATGGVEGKDGVEQGTIRFWTLGADKETGKPIHHGAAVRALAFEPSAVKPTIVSGSSDHVVRAFDVESGKQVERWLGHLGAVTSLACTKDGTIVSGSADGLAKAWDAHHSSGPEIIRAHDGWVQCVALNPKNTLLASGARDGSVKLWDPATARKLAELPKQKGAVTSVAFSYHGAKTFLAVGVRTDKNEGEITIWEVTHDAKGGGVSVKENKTLSEHTKGVTSVAFNPHVDRADTLISGSADKTVKLWNIATGKAKTYSEHKAEVRCVAFNTDGKGFASGGKDALICLYEMDKDEVWTIADLHLNSVETIAFLPTGLPDDDPRDAPVHLLSGSSDLTVKRSFCFKLEGGKTDTKASLPFRAHSQPITGVLFSDQGLSSLIASSSWDGAIKLYDLASERFTLLGHHGAVRALAMANDQSYLVSAGNDGTLRFWRAHVERRDPKEAKEPQK